MGEVVKQVRKFKVGAVGNRVGIPREVVVSVLDKITESLENCCFVSGGAVGVDTYVEDYCKERGIEIEVIYEKEKNRESYFERNKKIAELSEVLICFICGSRKRSGTLNTLKHFLDMGKSAFSIYDEFGNLWNDDATFSWIKKKFNKIKNDKLDGCL